MKMVKKTLLAITVIALLATSAQAAISVYSSTRIKDPNGVPIGYQLGKGNIKVEGTSSAFWPFEYQALDLCSMPVKMKIGYFVSVKECHKRKIELVQVDCEDMGRGSGDWPCYTDCDNVQITTNFPIKVGVEFRDRSNIIDKYSAYIKGDTSVLQPGTTTISVCIDAWKAKLQNSGGQAGTWATVGRLVVTVKPSV